LFVRRKVRGAAKGADPVMKKLKEKERGGPKDRFALWKKSILRRGLGSSPQKRGKGESANL